MSVDSVAFLFHSEQQPFHELLAPLIDPTFRGLYQANAFDLAHHAAVLHGDGDSGDVRNSPLVAGLQLTSSIARMSRGRRPR